MQYRNFGKIDFKPSALGFGCMRLPTNGGKINEKEAIGMIRHAVDKGVNYLDTAYVYHNGESEGLVGKAVKDGYRTKVKIATKSPVWLIHKPGDFDSLLDEQLKRLDTDHIDFYLLHALGKSSWEETVLKHNLLEKMEAAKKAGKIGHIGFSFHDDNAAFHQIVDGYDRWEFCQIQYNFMDTKNQAGVDGLKYAASKGLAVIIMEPLLGGRLANPPAKVRSVIEGFEVKKTPAEWSLQWIWNQPEAGLILSGMSAMDQVEENLASADRSGVGTLGAKEMELVESVKRQYESMMTIPCTKCAYCMPCPNGVNIPRNFEFYNDSVIHDDLKGARFAYSAFFDKKEHAFNCTKCRACEELCPQKIEISAWMPKVEQALE